MEWLDLVKAAIGSSPVAICAGYAVHMLWKKLEAKDAEIARLNEARTKDLLSISRGVDDD